MKELSPINHDTTHEVVVPVEKRRHIESLKPRPGHRIWELNLDDGLIREVKPERVDAVPGEFGHKVVKKVTMKEGCIYCTALNAANADKKFMKMIALHKIIRQNK